MEIRDYYDKNKNRTGKTYTANVVPTGENYMLIVVCFIQNSKGEFLIQKASKQKGEKWGTTGGHPISKETSIQGMKREIWEELGIDIPEEKFIYVNTFIKNNKILDLYYIKEEININELNLQVEEVQEVKWATKEEISMLINKNQFEKTHAKLFNDMQYFEKK